MLVILDKTVRNILLSINIVTNFMHNNYAKHICIKILLEILPMVLSSKVYLYELLFHIKLFYKMFENGMNE